MSASQLSSCETSRAKSRFTIPVVINDKLKTLIVDVFEPVKVHCLICSGYTTDKCIECQANTFSCCPDWSKIDIVAIWEIMSADHCEKIKKLTMIPKYVDQIILNYSTNLPIQVDVVCPIAEGECGHKFHHHCIERWRKKRNTCPLCNVVWVYKYMYSQKECQLHLI